MNTSSLSPTLRFLIGLAAFAIGVNFIHDNASFINSFLLALLLVMSVSPLLNWLQRLRVPGVLAYLIRSFVSINAILGLIGGALTVVVLWLIGVELALLWGFAYFILGFIPRVGKWLALIPPLLLAFFNLGPLAALLVVAWYAFSSMVIGNVLKPLFMSGDLNLSPLWSIIATVFWSAILGLPGLILGVPLTIVFRELLLERDEGSRWLAQMMGSTIPDLPSENDDESEIEPAPA